MQYTVRCADCNRRVGAAKKTFLDSQAETDGVEIRRVRLRANAYHCQNGGTRQAPYKLKGNCDYGDGECLTPWPWHQQPAVMLLGRNYVITECDFWATWNLLYSGLTQPSKQLPREKATPAQTLLSYFVLLRFRLTPQIQMSRASFSSRSGCRQTPLSWALDQQRVRSDHEEYVLERWKLSLV